MEVIPNTLHDHAEHGEHGEHPESEEGETPRAPDWSAVRMLADHFYALQLGGADPVEIAGAHRRYMAAWTRHSIALAPKSQPEPEPAYGCGY